MQQTKHRLNILIHAKFLPSERKLRQITKFQLSPIDRYEKSSGETCKILLQNCRGSLRDFIHAPQ